MKKRPLVLYIAAAYSAPDAEGIARNVRRARAVGTFYRQRGAACIIPHQESLGCEDTLSEPEWLAHCLAVAERGDAIVAVRGPSHGKQVESAWMRLCNLPIFEVTVDDNDEVVEATAPTVEMIRNVVNS